VSAEVARKPEGENKTRKRRLPGHPKGLRFHVRASEQITAVCTQLGLPDTLLTFRDISDFLTRRAGCKVSLGTVHRFAKGEHPRGAKLRRALRLPPVVEVVPCACGQVHVKRGRCPNAPRPAELGKFAAAVAWLAGHERLTPPAVRVYGRRGKAVVND